MRRRLFWFVLSALALLALATAWIVLGLPSHAEVRALAKKNPGKTRLMMQREQEAREKARRYHTAATWVPLSRVSHHLIHAVLASEDQRFFGHQGVDWNAIQESIGKDVERRRFVRGGSTITQQLAKNLYFGTGRTLTRKLRELIVARWLEEDLGKVRILSLYLNLIEWGDGIYGCEAAARHWYGKPASALSATEAAGLAAMIPNPRRLNPRANPARHARATRRVLWLMALAGYLGRDAARLGVSPPPDSVEDGGEPPATAPEPEPTATEPSPTSGVGGAGEAGAPPPSGTPARESPVVVRSPL